MPVPRKSMATTPSSSTSTSVTITPTTTNNNDQMDMEKSARRRRKRTSRLPYIREDDHKKINIKPTFNIPMKFMELLIEDYVQIKLRRKLLRLKDSLRKTAKNLLDDYLSDRQQKECSLSSSSTLAEKFSKLDPPLHFSMDPFSTNLRFDNIGLNTRKSCCEEYYYQNNYYSV
ncbi:hypothetical protein BLA29_011819 [Euroglyphus maynei]|uniref:Uncharacterized protein n=1 Tax=Euroglyphus maynei TaxID=6958 RepID=A0A1Y3BSP1_EURMA|nr:hypothetical protein BLA29_011819 [Euroglyphus maynei]